MAQLLLHPLHKSVDHGGAAVHHTAAHTVNRIFADDAFGLVQTDTRQLSRATGQCVQRHLDTGEDHAAHIDILRLHHLDGGSGAHIHQDQRCLIFRKGRNGHNNPVAAHLRRHIHMNVQAGLQTGANHHRLLADDLDDTGFHRVKYRRHNGRNDTVRNIGNPRAEGLHHVFDLYAILVRGAGTISGDAGFKKDFIITDSTNDDVCISNIDG